ncbi:MAG: DUF4070 domain-containing protein [Methylacidiphilales bacterium]|nr:DUF4070 domain-containing protein [Candidatus Methylacidiphilales bacterium]
MNILLVYPEIPDTFWSFKYALKFIGKKAAFPPLGLLTVAALLPRQWPKRLIDLNIRRLRNADLEWADYVFLSGMTVQRDSAREVIERCNALGVPVVAGGPLFTTEFETISGVAHFVLNEAEITLPMFLDDLRLGVPQPVYRTGEFADIRTTPMPLWELAELKKYATMNLQYSRGCPFQCEFCNVTALFGHRPRTKTAQQVLAELNYLKKLGWKGKVFFVDDNLIGNKHHLMKELLPPLIEWQRAGGGMPFLTEASINISDDPRLMEMMREAGFESVFVGIETPSEESLAECNKKQNAGRDLISDIKRIQRAGLEVQGGFIVGFDSDTSSIFQRQIDFIQKSGIVVAMVGLLQAVKGTRLYDRLQSEGRLRGSTSGDNVDGTTNIVTRMDEEQLLAGYQKILNAIYSPRNFYARLQTFLREYRVPKVREDLTVRRFGAFIRSIFSIGIFGRERFYYWKLLLWTLFARPRLMPQTVTMAIYGIHFRTVCHSQIKEME